MYFLQKGNWNNNNYKNFINGGYYYTEKIFIFLSFLSKSLFVWNIVILENIKSLKY
jgi:hypothetical protein